MLTQTSHGNPKNNTITKLLAVSSVIALSVFGAMAISPTTSVAQAARLLPEYSNGQKISFADLVEEVSPAVVSIHTEQLIEQAERPDIPPEVQRYFSERFGEDFFDRQFNQRQQDGSSEEETVPLAQGSGFFVDGKGHIVTNNHVIKGAQKIYIRLDNGDELEAELVGVDPGTDLAVLKVDAPRGQAFVKFAENVKLRRGDWVLAVGNPFGLGGTVTSGIVSATGRENGYSNYSDFIQIDASINRGNSGGPTFDLNGRVVGVNTAIYSPSGGSVGIGFAIPGETARKIVEQLIEKGSVSRGWLGVEIRPFDRNEAAAFGLENTKGALVTNVQKDTPARQAGLQNGDIVLEFNGAAVDDARDLTRSVGSVEPGVTVELTVYRGGKKRKLDVKLGDREKGLNEAGEILNSSNDNADIPSTDQPKTMSSLGLGVSPLDDEVREALDLPSSVNGLVVQSVDPHSAAAQARLQRGTIILEIDNKKIRSMEGFEATLNKLIENGKEAVILRVQEGERKDFRALPLGDLQKAE
ncbi:MAG: Do family serine endopeptidase [bacterium]